MTRTRTRVGGAGLATALVAMLLLTAACSGRAGFDSRKSFTDVKSALHKGGLDICRETDDPDGLANQATDTRTFTVATDCPTGESVRLIVDRYPSADDRDGAARQFEQQTGDGAVWTYGPFTLFANGVRDDDVMEGLTDALDAAGAK